MAARQGEPNAPGALEESESADLGQEEEPALEEGLTDAQLMEVFKQTSIFNVKSALANNENLVHAEAEDELQTDLISDSDLSDTDEWEYLRGFWSGKSFLEKTRKGNVGQNCQYVFGIYETKISHAFNCAYHESLQRFWYNLKHFMYD